MKKIVSFVLMLCMMLGVLGPLPAFAQDSKELEGIIKSVKERIMVSEKLTEFNYSVYTQGDKQIWNLSWNSKDSNDGSINVSVQSDGTIQNYNYYKPYSNPQDIGKLPKLSITDAQKVAEDFIKKINPTMILQLKLDDNNYQNLMDPTYTFNFLRYVNNIPFRANNVSVSVDRQEGFVQSYYSNWTDNLKFPLPDKAISLEAAKAAYKEKLGLALVYNYRMEDDKIVTYLAYQPKFDNYYIDAFTGEKVKLQNDIYYPRMADGLGDAQKSMNSTSLTPQEQKAVDEVSNVFTREKVEKIARDNALFGLTDQFKVTNAGLYKDWYPSKNLIWTLDFAKQDDKDFRNVSVRIDAKTGEILNFYISSSNDSDAKSKYNVAEAKAAVEKFLGEFCGDKFKNSVYDDNYEGYVPPIALSGQKEDPKSYSFRYLRKINGVPFLGNFLSVGFDAVSGKITSFDSQWFDTNFNPTNKIISADKAYDVLFNSIGYELQYRTEYNNEILLKFGPQFTDKNAKPEVKLIYAPNPQKPAIIDAFKGIILNNGGTPYKDSKAVSYTDIDNSPAKDQINFLVQNGISFEGQKFRPTYKITQKEFLYLIARVQNPYDQYILKTQKDTERLYSNLISQGVIKASEKAPNALITKEDAAKFVIRSMKYDKIAELKNILVCGFDDAADINQNLTGYVVLANSLGIVTGESGKFNPKSNVTREQAAVIIYNLLKK